MSIVFTRFENVGWASWPIEYLIEGSVTPGRGATYEDPAEDWEVDVKSVARVHPASGDAIRVEVENWPFDDIEWGQIHQQLCEAYEPDDDCGEHWKDE